ncbi:MAG: hypothetical protein ACK5L3_14520 [Oscillospiraceae bacterium]
MNDKLTNRLAEYFAPGAPQPPLLNEQMLFALAEKRKANLTILVACAASLLWALASLAGLWALAGTLAAGSPARVFLMAAGILAAGLVAAGAALFCAALYRQTTTAQAPPLYRGNPAIKKGDF